MWRRDCYKPHYKSPFGRLTDEVYSYTDVHYVPQQQLQHTEISPQRLIPQQRAKKIPPKVHLLQNGSILCSNAHQSVGVHVPFHPLVPELLSGRLEPVETDI